MNKNQVIIMLILGAFLTTGMFIPSSAHAYSPEENIVVMEPALDEALAFDEINYTLPDQPVALSLSANHTKNTIRKKPILIAPEHTEVIKETTPEATEPTPTEAPKADAQEIAPQVIKAPKQAEPAKQAVPAPTEPQPTNPIPNDPKPTEPEVVEPESPEPTPETVSPEEDIYVEEPEQDVINVGHSVVDLNDSRNDDYGNCSKCGRHLWTYMDQTGCFTVLSDATCSCGVFIKAGQCHHH